MPQKKTRAGHHHVLRKHFAAADPIIAEIIARVGQYGLRKRPERFQALVRAIIFQQLAGAAALAIYNRFVGLFGDGRFPTPQEVLARSIPELRSVGLSQRKIEYIRDLAARAADGRINFHRFARMADEAIIEELTQIRGIGRWTAEMFLMFNLGRPDVLPVGDLGVRSAVMKAYAMARRPTPKELRALGEKWSPHRTAVSWYLWQSLRIITPGADAKLPIERSKAASGKRRATAALTAPSTHRRKVSAPKRVPKGRRQSRAKSN
ncbi:MAG TPA: DNA-3-methyladenine glycosylase [Candidatus Binataceae bacterium]|nr:DNA-3-methyladenine glycosylase [Candidatus Binataceae bacterium]